MKKVLAVVMALVLMLGMSVQAFGAETSASKDIYLTTTTNTEGGDNGNRDNSALGFEISWGSEDVTIEVERKEMYGKKWDPETLQYVKDESSVTYTYSSDYSMNVYKVTNLSAVEVVVNMGVEYADGITNIPGEDFYVEGSNTLAAATEGEKGGQVNIHLDCVTSATAEELYRLAGEDTTIKLATVTITVSAAE